MDEWVVCWRRAFDRLHCAAARQWPLDDGRDRIWCSFVRPLPPTPALGPGPRLRRGRSWARAPTARKRCLLAPLGEGLLSAPAWGAMRLSRRRGACVC
ncbi:hypothetical protein XocBAI15_07695 [Xanthomonas oryzae pv. oryzicola]|nr:hypothetical protein XocBAI15_07695 [Xanthomonas oryzae pv. oryzicola]OWB30335.1 hypothetical protein XocBAI20_09350 [Xanthomonas oryzae pv. oryzicola]